MTALTQLTRAARELQQEQVVGVLRVDALGVGRAGGCFVCEITDRGNGFDDPLAARLRHLITRRNRSAGRRRGLSASGQPRRGSPSGRPHSRP